MIRISFSVAGLQFHGFSDVAGKMDTGGILALIPDPANKYDSNAVGIWFLGVQIGYVPKRLSEQISKTLSERPLTCKVLVKDLTKMVYNQLTVEITEG